MTEKNRMIEYINKLILGMAKIPIPNGKPETRTRFDWGIPRLTGDGDGDGEYPNKKNEDGDGDGDTLNP